MSALRIYVDFAASPEALELLRAETLGHELLFPETPASSVLAQPEHDPQLERADIAFGQPEPAGLARARQLKWIQVSSSSITRYDNPDFRALVKERQIAVCNSARVYNEACAVHALSFMLAQARHLPVSLVTRAASGTPAWNNLRNTASTLRGETAVILGFGAIGARLVELLGPFHMKILAYRRKAHGDEPVPVLTSAQLMPALGEARHVIDILPDNPETRHFFDARQFAAIKPGAVFYNIGRGATVDQEALLFVLRSGHLAVAWLDVTEPEPLPDDHPLWKEPNCFITPHVAGGHPNESVTLVRHFLDNLKRFTGGKPLLDRVM